ncbi:MAG: Omp28 family outer membrane lipoprotein [Bacteroidetes bacterium]|nr:Omp28 family outer membrane lipoprotein [Bacteroidota bacterium]
MKAIRILLLLPVIAAFFISCDKIDSPYVNVPVKIDTAACPVPEFPAVTNHVKRVLLEDYTGHTCPNCPTAGKIARDLKEQYSGQVIVMAVHAGWFARTYPGDPGVQAIFNYDFRTPAGTDWDTKFGNGNAGNPNGLVNRLSVNNKFVLRPDEWSGKISSALTEAPKMDLQLIVDYDPTIRKICAHTNSIFLTPLNQNLKMEVVITEDSIIAAQKNNDAAVGPVGDVEDFVHMHVMRGALNGTWGSELINAGDVNPESVIESFQSTLPEKCVAKNCHIIAFIFDKDSYEVLQAAEVKLTE